MLTPIEGPKIIPTKFFPDFDMTLLEATVYISYTGIIVILVG